MLLAPWCKEFVKRLQIFATRRVSLCLMLYKDVVGFNIRDRNLLSALAAAARRELIRATRLASVDGRPVDERKARLLT
jgi:hypothetical protein